LSRFW